MKIIKLLSVVIVSALAFSSCKNNMQLTKRHYTKGYYFHKSRSVEAPEVKEGVASTQSNKEKKVVPIEMIHVSPSEQKELSQNNQPKVLVASSDKKINHPSKAHKVKDSKDKSLNETKTELQVQSKEKASKKKSSDGDTDLIVQIILALFPILCLIAVYLHDGKSITLNFWIDLLLHLTVFLEVIFAILVVLDVVNLN